MQQNTIKYATIALLALTITTVQTDRAHAEPEQPPSLLLDGRPLAFPAPPVIENGVSYVPVRPIFEAEGAKVKWDEQTKSVTAMKDDTVITYRMGESSAYKNGKTDASHAREIDKRILHGSAAVRKRDAGQCRPMACLRPVDQHIVRPYVRNRDYIRR